MNKVKRKKNVVILDFEANAQDNDYNGFFQKEIIEIGAVKLKDGVEVSRYETFVRPILNTTLTPFIKELTSIKQSDVDNAPLFKDIYKTFSEWVGDAHIISCGKWDKEILLREMHVNEIDDLKFKEHVSNNFEDIKDTFAKVVGIRRRGLKRMLNYFNITPEGTAHRAIDDSINTAEVYRRITVGIDEVKNEKNK